MKKYILNPHWILLPLAAFMWNQVIYQGAFFLTASRHHFDFALPVDSTIPLIPWTIVIYYGCFLHWGLHYICVAKLGNRNTRQFYAADFLIKSVSFLFFLCLPTVMHRPEVTGTGFWNDTIRFLYWMDKPYNLFPSIHCSVSWLCWISVRKNTQVPKWYRYFALIAAIAVCLSTLSTRQHVLVDIAGGLLVAEVCWALAAKSLPN